jgi:hypothetical protein
MGFGFVIRELLSISSQKAIGNNLLPSVLKRFFPFHKASNCDTITPENVGKTRRA